MNLFRKRVCVYTNVYVYIFICRYVEIDEYRHTYVYFKIRLIHSALFFM